MMTLYGLPHFMMILATIVIIAILMIIIRFLPYVWQNVMIYSLTFLCMAGIFFLHGTHYGTSFDPLNLLRQQLQVCNFNFILLPICLIKRNELGRQYLLCFSMFAALSTFAAYPSDVQNSMWNSVVAMTFWVNHSLIVAIPLLMVAARRLKPQKEYVWPVLMCVFLYFLVAFFGNSILNGFDFNNFQYNYSYTMGPGSIMVLEPFYNMWPMPFMYLLPLAPFILGLLYFFAFIFKKYRVRKF